MLVWSICSWPVCGTGELFHKSESPHDLEKELQRLVSLGMAQSEDPEELRRLASMYLDLGYALYSDPKDKIDSFREGARMAKKALELDESSARAHFLYAANFGKAAQLQGWVAAARALQTLKYHVNRVLELDEKHALAHYMLGVMYEELPWFLGGDSDVAGEYLKKTLALDTRYAPARLDLGKWYLKRGDSQKAAAEFMKVINTPPFKKRWIWERLHRPEAEILLQQIRVGESPGPLE